MNTRLPPDETVGAPYVSTGHLPSSELVKALVAEPGAPAPGWPLSRRDFREGES